MSTHEKKPQERPALSPAKEPEKEQLAREKTITAPPQPNPTEKTLTPPMPTKAEALQTVKRGAKSSARAVSEKTEQETGNFIPAW